MRSRAYGICRKHVAPPVCETQKEVGLGGRGNYQVGGLGVDFLEGDGVNFLEALDVFQGLLVGDEVVVIAGGRA